MSSARPAIVALAAHELRRRWRSLVLLGLAAGIVVGTVAGLAGVASRTGTTLDRLRTVGGTEDARVQVFAGPEAAEALAALPGVEASWAPSISVGRLPGAVNYVAVLSGPEPPEGLFEPVVVEGRAADPEVAEEVVVSEAFARAFGYDAGDRLPLHLLTAEEVAQFDVGFGDPDGPRVDLRITGLVRQPPGAAEQSPVIAGPAFAEAYGDESAAGGSVLVRLADGAAGLPAFTEEVEALAASFEVPEGAEEFAPLGVVDPAEGTRSVSGATRILVTGLVVMAVVVAVAGLFAVTQAFTRHHGSSAPAQRVEAALGLTVGDRMAARSLPALVAAAVAGLAALAMALASGVIEPLGPLGELEPSPGWRPEVGLAVLATVLAVAVVLVMDAVTARRAGRGPGPSVDASPVAPTRTRVTGGVSRPSLVAGVWFALFPGRGGRAVPVRSAVVSVVLGVAGLVAAVTFTATLDRLEADPGRWGWPGDVVVVDAAQPVADELVDDPRTTAVGVMDSSFVVLDDRSVPVWSVSMAEGELEWTTIEGRLPTGADEVALGARLADDLGLGPGDVVVAEAADGSERQLRVTGLSVMPAVTSSRLGTDAVVTPEALAELGSTAVFSEAMVEVAAGTDVETYVGELGARYELVVVEPPDEVANLADLGGMPLLLGAFLGAVGALALTHALVVIVRRRARDLAVLRSLGFTPGQVARAVTGTAVVTVLVGAVVGVPLGLALGRFTWWVAAVDAGIGPDVAVPWPTVLLTVPAAVLLAVVVAATPAVLAGRQRPGPVLRTE